MVEIEDTYAEAFEGLYSRLIITAATEKLLKRAAYNSTALPSVVINRTEGGVEKWLGEGETPDGRKGAVVQFWGRLDENRFEGSVETFYKEISYRIRQGILVTPTTALFNATDSEFKIDTMRRIGHCGDGYEWEENYMGRRVIRIPLMMGDFIIERNIGYGRGVMGGNVWFLCADEKSALEAGYVALDAISRVDGVITPFDICSAGSKPETKYPEIGPTTNHPYCPTLRHKIKDSKVPNGVGSIPEIVINGITLDAVKKAMREAINAAKSVNGVVKISAGNYGGRLGKYKIPLRQII
ncbi:MAG: formylmethanofuran--tetrahydromethanopterin N-formyltransferase [Candidatus Bathyarchaeia archaeon]